MTASVHSAPARRRWLGMVFIGLGVSLVIVDATIVNVMLPKIVGNLRLRSTDAEWIVSIYSLVFAALLIPFGRLGDLIGRKRMFLLGTAVFVLASLFAARADSGSTLIAARLIQGVGASMIMPATLSTVNAAFTGRDRAIAFGIWGSLIGGMAAVGPLLGGWLATSYGWRWGFAVNIPLGLLIIVGTVLLVPETRDPKVGRGFDVVGTVLLTTGLGALVFALIEGQRYLGEVPVALAVSAVALTALVLLERRRLSAGRSVILDLNLFRIQSFRAANITACLVSFGEFGLLFVLPFFLQNARHGTPLQTSLAILPLAIGAFLAGPMAARLSARRGAHQVVRLGLALETIAAAGVGLTLHATSTGLQIAPWMFVYGVGLGLASAQLTSVALRDVPRAASGQASGTQSTARQVGSALGVAVLGTLFAVSLGHVMTSKLHDGALPTAQRTAVIRALRDTSGTSARSLHDVPGYRRVSADADDALAVSASRVAYGAAFLLALGLLAGLRLRGPAEMPREGATGPSIERDPEESMT
jgi:EmrB/QacA subfamily drug resistance transporter